MYSVAEKKIPDVSKRKQVSLSGDKAKQLWLDGKDAWNNWVEENPNALIYFRNGTFKFSNNDEISFKGYQFPNTYVDFSNTTFTANIVDFSEAVFPGGVDFTGASFHAFRVLFHETYFVGGEIASSTFNGADFSNCLVGFNSATFIDEATFCNIKSKNGSVSFDSANFEQCNLFFVGNKIESTLIFNMAKFGSKRYLFEECHFYEHVDFSNIINEVPAENISFEHSSFYSSLDLSGNNICTVIDLTNTKTANRISLSGLNCKLNKSNFFKAKNAHDSVCFMRLKEIAASNNDHQSALKFHANEMRSKRWQHEAGSKSHLGSYGESLLDTAYDWTCDYGQSISKPILWLMLLVSIFTTKYAELSQRTSELTDISNLIIFSLGNSLPFISISKLARESKIKELFSSNLPELYDLMMLQGGLSFIFIFLIGLGLRNRFRI